MGQMISKFRHLSLGHFLWMSIVASELLTGFVVLVMSIIFRGRVTFDYLITGAVASLIVSALVVSIMLAKQAIKIRPDIPVILCTGFSESIGEETAKGIGIRELAMKPLVMKDLAMIIRKGLDG